MLFYLQMSFITTQIFSLLCIATGYELLGYSLFVLTLPSQVVVASILKKSLEWHAQKKSQQESRELFMNKKADTYEIQIKNLSKELESLKNSLCFTNACLKVESAKPIKDVTKYENLRFINKSLVSYHMASRHELVQLNLKLQKKQRQLKSLRILNRQLTLEKEYNQERKKFYTGLLFKASRIIKAQRKEIQSNSRQQSRPSTTWDQAA